MLFYVKKINDKKIKIPNTEKPAKTKHSSQKEQNFIECFFKTLLHNLQLPIKANLIINSLKKRIL
jgi:hypothetical protein